MEFPNEREAEDAIAELKGKDMGGLALNIGKLNFLIFSRMEQEVQQVRPWKFQQTSVKVSPPFYIFKGNEMKGATTATNLDIMQESASQEGKFFSDKI